MRYNMWNNKYAKMHLNKLSTYLYNFYYKDVCSLCMSQTLFYIQKCAVKNQLTAAVKLFSVLLLAKLFLVLILEE